MATTKTTKKLAPAETLEQALEAIGRLPDQKAQYKSAAALVEAAAPGTKQRVATRVRQVMRDAQKKVGRGHRYETISAAELLAARKTNQATKAQAKAAVAQATVKPSKAKKTATPKEKATATA